MTPLVQHLAALAAEGKTAKEAGAIAGVTAKSARMLGYRHGFRFAFEGIHNARRVRAAAKAGMTPAETARHLGIERSNVHRIAKKHGILFRTHFARLAEAKAAEEARLAAERAEAKAREEAERMARWRAAWAEKKAAKAAQSQPRPLTPLEAMHRLAARENAAMRRWA